MLTKRILYTNINNYNETAIGPHVYRKGAPMPPPPCHSSAPITFLNPYFVVACVTHPTVPYPTPPHPYKTHPTLPHPTPPLHDPPHLTPTWPAPPYPTPPYPTPPHPVWPTHPPTLLWDLLLDFFPFLVSWRGGVHHEGVEWGGVHHEGVGWGGWGVSWRGGVDHAGVGCIMKRLGGSWRGGLGCAKFHELHETATGLHIYQKELTIPPTFHKVWHSFFLHRLMSLNVLL